MNNGQAQALETMNESQRSHFSTDENLEVDLSTARLRLIGRGPFQACYLGFGLDAEFVGQGLMQEALEAVLHYAFVRLGLHRIMANYLPENGRSERILARMGFQKEGYAVAYLHINGAWRDHVLTARINPGDHDEAPLENL